MRDDPDWQDFIDIDWSKAVMVIPQKKKAISIRLDEDIIDFFQQTGKGYQTRINAVLRHFISEQKRSKGSNPGTGIRGLKRETPPEGGVRQLHAERQIYLSRSLTRPEALAKSI